MLSLTLFFVSCCAASAAAMENEFDTYNADICGRVRRAYTSLSDAEKDRFIRGLLQLRDASKLDDFEIIMSEHLTAGAAEDHKESNFLFWHGYLLWEVESRIRNLGGEFACFAMPFWDYTAEAQRTTEARGAADALLIFDEFVGGNGDPEDASNVNGFSWAVSVDEWWVPYEGLCGSHGDKFPLCSLKRSVTTVSMQDIPDVESSGRAIRELNEFRDFGQWFTRNSDDPDWPTSLIGYEDNLGSVKQGLTVMTLAFDPIWLMFHSFIQYQQFIWVDCNDYDLIAPEDLDDHQEAYSAYCDDGDGCDTPQVLDAPFEFPRQHLYDAEWSIVHSQPLTVRKTYHAPRWNIQYDLGAGDGYFHDAGLDEWCAGRLNPQWFRLDTAETEESAVLRRFWTRVGENQHGSLLLLVAAVAMMLVLLVQRCRKQMQTKDLAYDQYELLI